MLLFKKKQSYKKNSGNYYVTVDGKRVTNAEFKELKENSIPLPEPYYIVAPYIRPDAKKEASGPPTPPVKKEAEPGTSPTLPVSNKK